MPNQHTALPLAERFWGRTAWLSNGCLIWQGPQNRNGYGIFGKTVAHRVAYQLQFGRVPSGKELDHLCGNRLCVEATHLEPVTRRENIMRSANFAAVNARKTHCPKGHPYSGRNLLIRPNGDRRCRTCVADWNAAHPLRNSRHLRNARLASEKETQP